MSDAILVIDAAPPFPAINEVARMAQPLGVAEGGYYGLPFLKSPRWGWEIALYFFCEGVSAGCFVYAATADLFGGPRYRTLARAARLISFGALLPCPPLLIKDLGRPERFHHMLRIAKRTSPMSVGAWALTCYSAHAAMTASAEYAQFPRWPSPLVWNLAGLPFAMTMVAYPGVLLATTSTPVWMRSRVLGALLASSSMATAASALALSEGSSGAPATIRIEKAAHACEAVTLAAYLWTTGDAAEPLVRGRQAKLFWLGAIGVGFVLPAAIRAASKRRAGSLAASLLSLAGGLALKWALVHAGRSSALDAAANHRSMRRTEESPGWSD
jgi:formate-dependent nitrite reductase membrane component NrfD